MQVQVQHYIGRAKDFLEGMQVMRDDRSYWNSSALLAIHSAIAYTDALRAGLGDQELAAEDHSTAVAALGRLLSAKRLEGEKGLKHLRALIAVKSSVAYGVRRLDFRDYQLLFTQAERFAKWANGVGSQLGIAGWTNDEQ